MVADPVAEVDAGLMAMHRTREQWEAVNPDAFLTGSIDQARNVIEMARADILRLHAALQAAKERGAERMRERAGKRLDELKDAHEGDGERWDMAFSRAAVAIRALPLSETETKT